MAEAYSGPAFDEIRASLAALVTEGVAPYNVADNGGALLELQAVTGRVVIAVGADEDDEERAYAEALVAVLKEAVDKRRIQSRKHRRLLKYVLPLREELLEKTIEQRRTAAGKNLTDGKKVVKPGTVRTYYEPRALDRLARALIAIECEHRGEVLPDALAEAS